MPTIPQMLLRQNTHRHSKEQGLYTCTPTASIFVCFFLKVHHPPLESSESHAGGAAALKVCQRGEAPGPGQESPIATQSPRQRTSPVQEQNRGEGRRPLETHCPSTRCFKTTQILFHSETCVATVEWTDCDHVLVGSKMSAPYTSYRVDLFLKFLIGMFDMHCA